MMTLVLVLIPLIIALLGAAFVFAHLSLRANKRSERLASRLSDSVEPHARGVAIETEEFSLARTETKSDRIKRRMAAVINLQIHLIEHYPLRWWIVPIIGLIVSRGIIAMLSAIIGHGLLFLLIGWPVLAVFLTRFIYAYFHDKRRRALFMQFPDALGTVVRSVRVGIPVGEAMRTVARDSLPPTRDEFSILADKVSIGIPLDAALRELAIRNDLPEYQFFATALTLQARSGGGITQTLETLADVIRKRVALKARGFALTSEARTSAMVLGALPFFGGGLLLLIDTAYVMTLFTTPQGHTLLGIAAMMLVTGQMIMAWLIRKALN
ncbi:MAG TPA: type II secretion system F family protein [Acetobacteraceae bacterium]|nr:MAG: hypothetical protein B7Z81_07615 [Acidocella sp. 20-61-6]HQT68756.1 type II secretion system F family protein [Acetobacteraceae bacterium]